MTSIALANVRRAQNLDRLYLAAEQARQRWLRAGSQESPYDLYCASQLAQHAYEEYRAMCTASPLNPLLESVEDEEP